MQRIDLNGKWKFKAIDAYRTLPKRRYVVRQWMPARIPGTVHTDLLANRRIPDPFYRMNENDVQWVDSVQWVYRREFEVPAPLLDEEVIHLVAEGLDTYARIRCNGRPVGETSNMFVEHRLDIKGYLHPGKNSIEVLFDSPTHRSKALEKKHGPLRVALEPHRVYVRKAQYSFGWDWGPRLTTSGIWRNISVQGFSQARLRHPFVKVLSANKREAIIQVSAEIERSRGTHFALMLAIDGERSVERTAKFSSGTATIRLRIPQPRFWWPNGFGDQPMYTAVLSLLHRGKEIDRMTVPFAIRTVRLVEQKDRDGKSFIVEVNGKRIFCKGADWIPGDNFIPRIPASTYASLLRLAKDAHMNMIRVWGGGIYEESIFYDLCDSLGLMVWQDFMYACAEYPEEPWFLKQARQEAEKVVRRLRNHPSIVVWCGNNECEWLFCTENPDSTVDDMCGAKIFRDVLPDLCRRLDGTRPYWRSSPFGDGLPNDESNGNHHQWFVWSSWKDYEEYANDNARFVTEFGFQSPANLKTMEEVTVLGDRYVQSPVMEHHNKQLEGPERLIRFQGSHYRLGGNLDDFIYKAQLVQAEALKYGVEHWRRRKFRTAGALFWQLNDCWPVSSWSVVDSALRPKAGYYYSRRFFAPILISFKQTSLGIEVWVTSDLMTREIAAVSVALRSFGGKTCWETSKDISISPAVSKSFILIKDSHKTRVDPATHYIHAKIFIKGNVVSENRFFFLKPKYLKFPRSGVTFSLRRIADKELEMTLHAKRFAGNVRVIIEGEDVVLNDNYFDMDADSRRVIRFRSKRTQAQLRNRIRLHWLEK